MVALQIRTDKVVLHPDMAGDPVERPLSVVSPTCEQDVFGFQICVSQPYGVDSYECLQALLRYV